MSHASVRWWRVIEKYERENESRASGSSVIELNLYCEPKNRFLCHPIYEPCFWHTKTYVKWPSVWSEVIQNYNNQHHGTRFGGKVSFTQGKQFGQNRRMYFGIFSHWKQVLSFFYSWKGTKTNCNGSTIHCNKFASKIIDSMIFSSLIQSWWSVK